MENKKNKSSFLSLKIEPDIKTALDNTAKLKGMDLSKLARAILTNWIKPNTFTL